MQKIVLAMTVLVVLSGCGSNMATTDTGSEPTKGQRDWGPLAVTSARGGDGEALLTGTLRVTNRCVVIEEQGEDVLLVWDAEQTTWNPDTRTITFENGDGAMTVGNGDELRVAGGGSSVDEGGATSEEWAVGMDWVSKPASECLTDRRWFVSHIEKGSAGS